MSVFVKITVNSELGDLYEYEVCVGADDVYIIAENVENVLKESVHESRFKRVV